MAVAIQPLVALCCVGVFLLVLYLTRFVSLSSILAGVAFMIFILFIFDAKETLYRIFAVLVALMIVLTHQKNIGRIFKGTESKVPILKYRDRREETKCGRQKDTSAILSNRENVRTDLWRLPMLTGTIFTPAAFAI